MSESIIKEMKRLVKTVEKTSINKPEDKKYNWEVMIVAEKSVKSDFEKDLDALFKKYVSKTKDGYIKVL